MTAGIGETAALGAALCWAVCAMAFTNAARRVGSLSVNVVRLGVAALFFSLHGLVARGQVLPLDATPDAWFWLGLSGVVGFFLCDWSLFESFLLIGPRLGLLIMSLNPVIATGMAWLWFGETIRYSDGIAIAVALGGVTWVVAERSAPQPGRTARDHPRGVLLALLAAFGQAGGVVLGKRGMAGYDPFASNHIRLLAGLACFAVLLSVLGRWGRVLSALRQPAAMAPIALGAFAGPFLGVGLLFLALQHSPTGIATTLASTAPVWILPMTALFHRERISPRAVAGAVLAVGGVAWLIR